MKSILTSLSLFTILMVQLTNAKMQTVNVSGTILCHGQRVMNMVIELWEFDRWDDNDLLNLTMTNEQGEFSLTGEHDEFFAIEPFLLLTHECGAKDGCVKQAQYYVPTHKIDRDYVMDHIALDIYTNGEKTLCGNKVPNGYKNLLSQVETRSE